MTTLGTPDAEAIARTVARSEITALLQRYANMAVEKADFAAMARLFTPDGNFILLDGTAVPVSEIERIVAGNEATWIRHHLTTIYIEFNGEGEASADAYYVAFTDLAQPDHWGRWRDTLRRAVDGQWQFTSMQPVVEGYHPDGWVATVLLPAMEANA